ncbi:MAG TPA: VOC family protein [Paraburkholderia sp.]|jgi:predicted 3-demethylubiquinone-9 3-methyltransferase (glyoxalase superfamily)|nr:VOC family protein [Paraburkholderia sp.]
MQKIAPCLWFDGRAEEAARFYIGVFGNSRITTTLHHTEASPGDPGDVLAITFELDGQEFVALNGGPNFTFSPAISLFVHCGSQEEIDTYWARLAEGGQLWQCGWLQDRFGVSWQIVPDVLSEMLRDPDRAKANRAMQAMMNMVKLDIAQLEAAFRG